MRIIDEPRTGHVDDKVKNLDNPEALFNEVTDWAVGNGMLVAGDRVVYVTGTGLINNTHNLLVVHEVPKRV